MSKHVLNTRLTGAVREGGRECVGSSAICLRVTGSGIRQVAGHRAVAAGNDLLFRRSGSAAPILCE
jgi:hypothetical protein